MVTKPTVDQVEDRLEVIPAHLRTALFSMTVTDLGIEVAGTHGLREEQIPSLAETIAWVLMGFVHASNAAEAIQEYVGIDATTAKAVAQELNTKLFQKYSADLEKIYVPLAPAGAKIMDIGMAIPMPPKVPVKPVPLPAMPLRMPVASSVPVQKTATPAPGSFPIASTMPRSTASAPTFKPPVLPTVPAAPATTAPIKPAPFIMHQESVASPLAAGADFKLNISANVPRPMETRRMDMPRPPKVAELEIGKMPLPPRSAPSAFRTAPPTAPRVIHYTDLRTSLTPGFSGPQMRPAPARPTVPPVPVTPPPPARPISTAAPAPAPMATIRPSTAPVPPKSGAAPLPPKPPRVVNFGPGGVPEEADAPPEKK